MHLLTKLVVGKRSGEIFPNSAWKVRTERTQPLVWPLVLTVSPLADEEREFLEWLASHGLTRVAARITKVACDLDDRRAYRRGDRERRVADVVTGVAVASALTPTAAPTPEPTPFDWGRDEEPCHPVFGTDPHTDCPATPPPGSARACAAVSAATAVGEARNRGERNILFCSF